MRNELSRQKLHTKNIKKTENSDSYWTKFTLQNNKIRQQDKMLRIFKNIFLKFAHFSPVTPYYDWVKTKLQKDTRKNKKDTVLYLFYKGETQPK